MRKYQSIRPFLQEIRKLIQASPREALENTILSLAKECRPDERETFINRLKPHRSLLSQRRHNFTSLVANLDECIQHAHRRQRVNLLQVQRFSGLEKDSGSNQLTHDITGYFDEAHKLFLTGEREAARNIYHRLLSLFFIDEEYPNIPARKALSAFTQGEIHETCSRYFRSLHRPCFKMLSMPRKILLMTSMNSSPSGDEPWRKGQGKDTNGDGFPSGMNY